MVLLSRHHRREGPFLHVGSAPGRVHRVRGTAGDRVIQVIGTTSTVASTAWRSSAAALAAASVGARQAVGGSSPAAWSARACGRPRVPRASLASLYGPSRVAGTMEFRILGPLEVIGSRGAVRLGGSKPRALLTVLLLNANEPVSADRLALALWGEDAPSGAAKTVQVHVSRLRKALGDGEMLATTPVGYRLRVGPGELDLDRFELLVEDGRRALAAGRAGRAATVLREALSLWRGPPLEDVAYEPFAQGEIARLEEQRQAALEARVEADLAVGRHDEVVVELQRLVAASPGRERLAGQLMLALYRCERQGEALTVYAQTRAFLSGELGLEPGPALQTLQRGILEQAAALDLQAQAGLAAEISEKEEPDPSLPAPLVAATSAEDTFVGRAVDIDALSNAYAEVAAGTRRLVLLCGEPGIGKTRLAAEFARRAFDQGAIVLYGRCDEEALLAQQPFVEALRHYLCAYPARELSGRLPRVAGELRRIVPEIADRLPGLGEPLAGDPEGARSRLFEAVGALLCEAAQRTPLVLVLDDLHWADKATLLLLKYVVRYPRDARLMVLGTYRDTELDVDHPLHRTLTDLDRERYLERRPLAPLDAAAVSELVDVHAGEHASSELDQIVYEGTEGNAFFVVEMLRHLAESGTIGVTATEIQEGRATGLLAVPDSVKDVIGQRIARLGPQANRLLATASVLGSEFEAQVLLRLSVQGEDEVIDGLEAAVRARVIEEIAGPAGRYTFSHALIRDTVYDALSATRRALLHRRACAAIEDIHQADLSPYLPELAHHFAQAGLSGDIDRAIEYGRRAGEHALMQSAYEKAAGHFRQTVALIDAADPARRLDQRCDLVIAQGEAERQAGDPIYRRTLLDAAALAQQLHDPERLARAALANNRGIYSSGQGIDRDRVRVLRTALTAYDLVDSPTRAALLALLALELTTDPDHRMRDRLYDEAITMARRVGDPRTLTEVLTQRCASQWDPSQTTAERRARLCEAAELADQIKDPLLAGHVAFHSVQAAMNDGDLEESDRLLAQLTTITAQLAQPFLRWYDALARAKRCAISGPPEEAERLAFTALGLGQRAGQPDSEMWFLGQVIAARFLQGTLDSGDPHLPDLLSAPGASLRTSPEITPNPLMPVLSASAMSMILAEVGRLDDARRFFEVVMSSELDLPPDYTAFLIPVYASVGCARLGDARSAERLHAILEPHGKRLITTGASWFGTVNHYLGVLAASLGRTDEAEARFADAARTYESLDARPWLARVRHDWAGALRASAGTATATATATATTPSPPPAAARSADTQQAEPQPFGSTRWLRMC
ncbi:MAG: BTAD domain-containing putative transcriptional regulator [Solirubrobacteraceae bacterium]